jgi:hypothetical protein
MSEALRKRIKELEADTAQDQIDLSDSRDRVRELEAELAKHEWVKPNEQTFGPTTINPTAPAKPEDKGEKECDKGCDVCNPACGGLTTEPANEDKGVE